MAWIKTIPPEDADGDLEKEYRCAEERAGRVGNVLRLSSLNPAALTAWVGLYRTVMHGPSPLSRAERELVATIVSQENQCHY